MKSGKVLIVLIIVLAVAAALMGGFYYFLQEYKVSTVHVSGNSHYTDDEIRAMVLDDSIIGRNALYLRLKYRNKPIKDVPFIERMDVKFDDRDTVTIEVYEKAVAGYVDFLGKRMYFDREGIVVESSDDEIEGIPQITGLKFDYCIVGKPLPVEDPQIFNEILSLTQLLTKYSIVTDGIYFAGDNSITLYLGDVRVLLGDMSYIDEKMMRLKNIAPELSGKKGVLHLENYTENTSDAFVTFEAD
ncbi:MAG: FtsQ-type POTRA domain-containing protein [Lachnospiraceae bacterium]|nr:FtsQ-type POTRA domain-containing protein [Lachnospiraceae bacterium]